MLLFFPVNCFNLFERLNIFFSSESGNSTESHIYSYVLCMQIYLTEHWRVGNSAATQKEGKACQFKGRHVSI